MIEGMEYKELYSVYKGGGFGAFAIKILVAGTRLPDLKADESRNLRVLANNSADQIEAAIMERVMSTDPECQQASLHNRKDLLALFLQPIFVEEIPNGYCSRWCCKHLPWFIVTTSVGRFKIGWRKRVISIDWEGTVGTATSEQLFAAENVTKEAKLIHAWSLEKASIYIGAIIHSAKEDFHHEDTKGTKETGGV